MADLKDQVFDNYFTENNVGSYEQFSGRDKVYDELLRIMHLGVDYGYFKDDRGPGSYGSWRFFGELFALAVRHCEPYDLPVWIEFDDDVYESLKPEKLKHAAHLLTVAADILEKHGSRKHQ